MSAQQYPVILVDPPWRFDNWGRAAGGRSAASHYPTMSIEEIAALPVADVAADDCVLFLWVTWPHLYQAHAVVIAWGFIYRTLAFDWVKLTKHKRLHFGMGYWTRANSEVCLLCTRGRPKRKDKSVPQIIWDEYEPETLIAPFRGHSVKPHEQYPRIERLVDGPYLELFARRARAGWDCWGNEAPAGAVALASFPAADRPERERSTPPPRDRAAQAGRRQRQLPLEALPSA